MRPRHAMALALILVLLGAFKAWQAKPWPDRIANSSSPSLGSDRQTGEWPAYGGDRANSKYSALGQISKDNLRKLRIAWRWPSPDAAVLNSLPDITPGHYETTPLMVHG